MKQLSGTDAMFLAAEHGNNYMHVASLAIYDPSTAPGGGVRFKDVLRHFTSRMDQFPQFRRRLVNVPFMLDRPYWVEDATMDVEYHVRHIALPHPGDWRQLCIQVARIHSRPLDRTKPLWEAYVIEGLHNVKGVPPGSFALYTKMHHAIVDGESGTEIMRSLLSTTPDSAEAETAALPSRHAADRTPTLVELYSRALVHNAQKVPSLARFSLGTAKRLASLGAEAVGVVKEYAAETQQSVTAVLTGDLGALLPKLPPATRFAGDVSAHRVFEAVGLPLADFKVIREQVGEATVNDQFLTIVGGAVREYLASKGELPDESLLAMVPMTLRGSDKGGDRGNQVGATAISVHTEIEDPVERLRAIRKKAATSKRLTDKLGKELMRDLLDNLPNLLTSPLGRHMKLPKIGLVVSNVRGPDVPLYLAGAQLVNYAPISIAVDRMGLNVTGFSYAGTMWICAVSCREMLPDPGYFAECLRNAFAALKVAAARDAAAKAPAASQRRKAARPASRKKAASKSRPAAQARGRRKTAQRA
jgi:WS/DGAT/MGAT family acyltransferase